MKKKTIDDPYPRGELGPIPRTLVGLPLEHEQRSFEDIFVAVDEARDRAELARAESSPARVRHTSRSRYGRSRKRGSAW